MRGRAREQTTAAAQQAATRAKIRSRRQRRPAARRSVCCMLAAKISQQASPPLWRSRGGSHTSSCCAPSSSCAGQGMPIQMPPLCRARHVNSAANYSACVLAYLRCLRACGLKRSNCARLAKMRQLKRAPRFSPQHTPAFLLCLRATRNKNERQRPVLHPRDPLTSSRPRGNLWHAHLRR